MAYEIGTASGYTDLLERLKDFLTDPDRIIGDHPDMTELVAINDGVASGESSQAWTELLFDDDRDSSGDGEIEDCYLMGPGTSGTDEIYVWMDTYHSDEHDYFNWRLAGMTGYASGQDISLQPGVTQGRLPRMLLWQNPIDYWFLGNGRRFVVIAKVSSVYEMCYGGFCLPYGLPTQFPYPLCIGGSACPESESSYPTHHRYSSLETNHRGFANAYGETAAVIPQGTFDTTSYRCTLKVMQGTNWVGIASKTGSDLYYIQSTNIIWPYAQSTYSLNPYDYWNMFSGMLGANIDGSYPIFPLVTIIGNPQNHILGELQGCFAVPGLGGISAEDTFDINGDTYIAFPIIPNASEADYMCIKKE